MKERRRFLEVSGMALAGCALPAVVRAQAAPGADPVTARSLRLRLVYRVRDLEATARFWRTLGATRSATVDGAVMTLGGIDVALQPGAFSASSDGSVVNHIAFRVPEFETLATALTAAGFKSERNPQFPQTLNAFTPEGDKVEIFNNESTSPAFTPEGENADPSWQRHNIPVTGLAGHHLHFYVAEGQERVAQEWYLARFGGTRGIRLRYAAVDYPGINLNFSTPTTAGATAPTAGRSLDRIGFRVRGLEALCAHLTRLGTTFVSPFSRDRGGVARALITDPWGTSIEVVEAP